MPARGQERHRQKHPLVTNVTKALGRRGGFPEAVNRGQDGPIEFEVKFRESGGRLATYSLKIGAEEPRGIVLSEVLKFRRGNRGQPWAFLNFARGKGTAIVNEDNHGDEHTKAEREEQSLDSADIRVASDFRKLIKSWHITQLGRTGGLLHTAECIRDLHSTEEALWPLRCRNPRGACTEDHGSHVDGALEALQEAGWRPARVLVHVIMLEPEYAGPDRRKLRPPRASRQVRALLRQQLNGR